MSPKKITKIAPKKAYRKTTKQTTTTSKRNMTVKRRKHVKWDPICYANYEHDDDVDGNDL